MRDTEKIIQTLVDLSGDYDAFQVGFLRQDIEKLVNTEETPTLLNYLEKLAEQTIFSCDTVQ